MSRVRSRLALVLVPVLASLAFVAAVKVAQATPSDGSAGATVLAGANPIDVRLAVDERRDGTAGHRLLKHRQAVLGVLAATLGLALLARRRLAAPGRGAALRLSWWSPRRGRAPPSPQLLAV